MTQRGTRMPAAAPAPNPASALRGDVPMSNRRCALLLVLLAVGCTPANPTTAELIAKPADYEGMYVSVAGPVSFNGGCNGAACPELPCNLCNGGYVLGEPTGPSPIQLVASDDWPFSARTPGPWDGRECYGDPECEGDLPLGCNGNDLEMQCAPAVPSRIVGVHGTVRRAAVGTGWEIVVDELDLADTQHEQTVELPGREPIRLFE